MQTFRDFLRWYNDLDVETFVEAVIKMMEFYHSQDIDLFKDAITVPGIARRLIFREAERRGAHFALFGKLQEDMYRDFKRNIVGGPSIVFHRYHKADETFIRGNPSKLCKRILGLDANALYLWAIGQAMPVGRFLIRRAETDFRADQPRDLYMSQFDYLEWVATRDNVRIRHAMNSKSEFRVGPYPVDGFCAETNTIYQFHGCYFHGGHDGCDIVPKIKNQEWREKKAPKLRERTARITAFLRARGYNVVERYECEWKADQKRDNNIKRFVEERWPKCFKLSQPLTLPLILEAVLSDRFFGAIECDIGVPESNDWPEIVRQRVDFQERFAPFTPREYFAEMAPLFVTSEIPMESIGEHMQQHAEAYNLGQKPRKL